MLKMRNFLSHITMILSLMFPVFLVLDRFNPMMNFVDNGISNVLLGALCLCVITQNLMTWKISIQRAKRPVAAAQKDEFSVK